MSFDTDPREEQDAEMYAAFAAKDKRIADLESQLAAASAQGEPVAWMWKEHGWCVTATSKYREVSTHVDTCRPPVSTQKSPYFISMAPLYTRPSVPAAKSLAATVADSLRPFCREGQQVIWHDALRWHGDNGPHPSRYDGLSIRSLKDHGFVVIVDCGQAAIIAVEPQEAK